MKGDQLCKRKAKHGVNIISFSFFLIIIYKNDYDNQSKELLTQLFP